MVDEQAQWVINRLHSQGNIPVIKQTMQSKYVSVTNK